jgi:tryptophan synthase beta chain
VIGKEARAQMLKRTGRLPDLLVAAIGGGINAIGLFHPFLDDAASRCSASKRQAMASTRSMPPA